MFIPKIQPITNKRLKQLSNSRNLKNYKEWRTSILQRDDNVCQYPACNSKEKLQVHHIKKYSTSKHLRTSTFNGITLCKKCHDKIYGYEHLYETLFFNIVKANSNVQKEPKQVDGTDNS